MMRPFSSFSVGEQASLSKVVSAEDVETFAQLTGDSNPIHLDETAAAESFFGRRVAHGMLSAGLISAVLGTKLPGPGGIYLSQQMRFLKPVFLDETVTAHVEIVALQPEKHRLTLRTYCTNNHNECVLDGEALLFYPPTTN